MILISVTEIKRMNRRGYAIVVSVSIPERALPQGRALRVMSRAKTVAIIPRGVDPDPLRSAFDEVHVGGPMDWISMDRFQSILFLEEGWIPTSQMDRLFLTPMPAMKDRDPILLLLEPSRFIPPQDGVQGLVSAMIGAGLEWSSINPHGLLSRPGISMAPKPGPPQQFLDHLSNILKPILQPLGDVESIIRTYGSLFQQAMVTKESDPSSNYELMEAYGDRFLGGQYPWLLLQTPGIITPDQVTKISSYFQDKVRLSQLVENLGLVPFIILGPRQRLDTKIQSDIIEALIAAIGIAWQKAGGLGNQAMELFVLKIFDTYFQIEPERYMILYENPKTSLKNLAEELRLNRDKIVTSSPQEQRGEMMVIVSYDGHLLGKGRVKTAGIYRDTAVDMATKAAYQDALEKGVLRELASTTYA